MCMVISGGHTQIVAVDGYTDYRIMGQTRDDAAGEAVDKVARVLGLQYPGGPNLEKLALDGDAVKYGLPRAFRGESHLGFSFQRAKDGGNKNDCTGLGRRGKTSAKRMSLPHF